MFKLLISFSRFSKLLFDSTSSSVTNLDVDESADFELISMTLVRYLSD